MSGNDPNYLKISKFLDLVILMNNVRKNVDIPVYIENKEDTVNNRGKMNFKSAPFTRAFLKSLPKSLREMFTPKNNADLGYLEFNIALFVRKEKERNRVMLLQRQFGLPIRPNMTLNRVAILVRIAHMKNARKNKYKDDGYSNPLNSNDGSTL